MHVSASNFVPKPHTPFQWEGMAPRDQLAAKSGRLETDYRAATAARDQLRQQLTQAEEHVQKLQVVVKERDELKVLLAATQGQFEQFRKSIKALLGQAEAAAGAPALSQPTAATTQEAEGNKS